MLCMNIAGNSNLKVSELPQAPVTEIGKVIWYLSELFLFVGNKNLLSKYDQTQEIEIDPYFLKAF
jgi:hypothetical protein